jgi:hypothetical protein
VGKVLSHLGFKSRVLPGSLTDFCAWWDFVPKVHNRVSNINFESPAKSKYPNLYLTPCCGSNVQDPTQALTSVKDPGNNVDLNPKWERTLPSLGNFSWDIQVR